MVVAGGEVLSAHVQIAGFGPLAAHPATTATALVKEDNFMPSLGEGAGSAETSHAGTDDCNFECLGHDEFSVGWSIAK